MSPHFRILFLLGLLVGAPFADEYQGRHAGINFGIGLSRPILSGFYYWDRNQVNLGTNLTLYTFEEGVLFAQPSLTYNRYLTSSGIYASLGLITNYIADQDEEVRVQGSPPDTTWHYRTIDEPDWVSPLMIAGIGKNFQWTRWGMHLDANLITPFGKEFIRTWFPWIGIGASYRFKLD